MDQQAQWERWQSAAGWLLWMVLLIVVSMQVLAGSDRTVTPVYREAAADWWRGQNLYARDGGGFLYLPTAVLCYAPLAALHPLVGDLAWRWLSVIALGAGLARMTRLAVGPQGGNWFWLATMVCLPTCASAVRNGQMTLLMTALVLHALADLSQGSRWRGAMWLSLAVGSKTLAVVPWLLVAALQRRARGPLLATLLLVFVAPFFTQRPGYVLDAYADSLSSMRLSVEIGARTYWATLFGMLEAAGFDSPTPVRMLLRVLASLATLAVCLLAQRRLAPPRATLYLFTLAALYILLFNPRTENNTYALLGPSLGIFAVLIGRGRDRHLLFWVLIVLMAGIVGSYELGHLLMPRAPSIWLAPLMALCFTVLVLRELSRDVRAASPQVATLPGRGVRAYSARAAQDAAVRPAT